jgi:hypothetical protein
LLDEVKELEMAGYIRAESYQQLVGHNKELRDSWLLAKS